MNLDKKTKMVAGCGVFLAALAGFAMYTATSKVENLVPVVVATQNIDPHVKITDSMVKIEQKPALARSDNMLDDPNLVVGGYSTTRIFAGQDIVQPMVSKQFDPSGNSGYAGSIPSGDLRAVSFPMNEANAVGGKISKGDYVDIIATFAPNNGATKLTKTIIQNVEVFDVATSSGSDGEEASSPSITLLLPLEQAEIVSQILKEDENAITYALNPTNPNKAKTTGVVDSMICKRYNFNCDVKSE